MKKWMKKFKNQRGLTLVELLAVIVILAIVAVIAFVMIGNIIENSKKDAHIANAQQIIASAKLYDTQEGITSTVDADVLQKEGFLDVIVNPWDSNGEYKATVTKVTKDIKDTSDGAKVEYKISITANPDNCKFGTPTEQKLSEGRSICTE